MDAKKIKRLLDLYVGPLCTMALSLYAAIGAPVAVALGTRPLDTLLLFPFALAGMVASGWWMKRISAKIERWKTERAMAWWLKDLPEDASWS